MLEFEGIVFEECKLQFEFILTEIIIYQSQLDSQTRMHDLKRLQRNPFHALKE